MAGSAAKPETETALQWGHVFVDVEINRPGPLPPGMRPASMGPRLCRRGNRNGDLAGIPDRGASMGPRLCRRGNDGQPAERVLS